MKGIISWIAYEKYFGMLMGDQDKPWAPHVICGFCRTTLAEWLELVLHTLVTAEDIALKKATPFAVIRIWRGQKNHHDDCYFCMIDITKYNGSQALQYPDIPSWTAPVSHDDNLPVPQPPQNVSILLIILS